MVTLKIMPPAILVKRQFFKPLLFNCSQCGEKISKLELRKHTLNLDGPSYMYAPHVIPHLAVNMK